MGKLRAVESRLVLDSRTAPTTLIRHGSVTFLKALSALLEVALRLFLLRLAHALK